MKKITAFILTLLVSTAFAAEPQDVAEKGMRAWVAGDASSLYEVCHPDLISRMRTARILQHHLENDTRAIELDAIPDWRVVYLFCEALRANIPPRDPRFVYREEYLGSEQFGDITVARFSESVTARESVTEQSPRASEVVLKRAGENLKFLWFLPAQIHIDLSWDPRPSQ